LQPVSSDSQNRKNDSTMSAKKSEINFAVELDKDNVPEKIRWNATDNPNEGIDETRAISLAIWDTYHKGTLKIDLWTKEMPVPEMKQFCIEIIAGIGETLLNATGDAKMSGAVELLCQQLSEQLQEELRQQPR